MKTINLDFTKFDNTISKEKLKEKTDNFNFLVFHIYGTKKEDNNESKEIMEFLLLEYFNTVIFKYSNNKKLSNYENMLETFLSNKFTIMEVNDLLERNFQMEIILKPDLRKFFFSKLIKRVKKIDLLEVINDIFYIDEEKTKSLLEIPLTLESKKQFIKLYIIQSLKNEKNKHNFSESTLFLEDYKEKIQRKIFSQVSKEEIQLMISENKINFTNIISKTVSNDLVIRKIASELACHLEDVAVSKDDKNLIFNVPALNRIILKHQYTKSTKNQLTKSEKEQVSLAYVVHELTKNKNPDIQLWNKKTSEYEQLNIFKIDEKIDEDLIFKQVSKINSLDFLNSIHLFFKEIKLDNESNDYLYNDLFLKLVKNNVLMDEKNLKKSLIINKYIVLFNEKELDFKDKKSLLHIYIFEKIFKDIKSKEFFQDESVKGLEKFIPEIEAALRNQISERDIYNEIKIIETQLEVEPLNNYPQFHHLSVLLDAKNDLSFMKNETLKFEEDKKNGFTTVVLNKKTIDKLLNKTIDSNNVKELFKLCVFSRLMQMTKGIVRNHKNELVVFNDKDFSFKENIPIVIDKIIGKVLEKDIDNAFKELNNYIQIDREKDYIKRNVVYYMKEQVGIKVNDFFKHLL